VSVTGAIKKRKLEEAFNKRLERGKKKMLAKQRRQERKTKEKNNENA